VNTGATRSPKGQLVPKVQHGAKEIPCLTTGKQPAAKGDFTGDTGEATGATGAKEIQVTPQGLQETTGTLRRPHR